MHACVCELRGMGFSGKTIPGETDIQCSGSANKHSPMQSMSLTHTQTQSYTRSPPPTNTHYFRTHCTHTEWFSITMLPSVPTAECCALDDGTCPLFPPTDDSASSLKSLAILVVVVAERAFVALVPECSLDKSKLSPESIIPG